MYEHHWKIWGHTLRKSKISLKAIVNSRLIKPKNGSSFQRRGARAQSNAEKKWIVVKKNGNDNFSDGVNLHPLGVDDKVLKKRR